MVNDKGEYEFDASKLSACHGTCLKDYCQHVDEYHNDDSSVIIVDNTNISAVEIAPYYAVASAYGCEVEIVTLSIDQDIAFTRQKHGVSLGHHKRMASNLVYQQKQFPAYWNHKILTWNKEKDCYE